MGRYLLRRGTANNAPLSAWQETQVKPRIQPVEYCKDAPDHGRRSVHGELKTAVFLTSSGVGKAYITRTQFVAVVAIATYQLWYGQQQLEYLEEDRADSRTRRQARQPPSSDLLLPEASQRELPPPYEAVCNVCRRL